MQYGLIDRIDSLLSPIERGIWIKCELLEKKFVVVFIISGIFLSSNQSQSLAWSHI
jgi:hypothetical protein